MKSSLSRWIILFIILAVITGFTYCVCSITEQDYNHVEGWDAFEKTVLEKYDYVSSVGLTFHRSPKCYIEFAINREISEDEVRDVFQYTNQYIHSGNTIDGIIKFSQKKGFPIGNLSIAFYISDNRYYEIVSEIDRKTETFHNWFGYNGTADLPEVRFE